MKPKFHVGQVVYSLRWLCYGVLTKRLSLTLQEGRLWEMKAKRGLQYRREFNVVEKEIRPLTKKER